MKKIGLICLAVVLAVGALGLGYADWSQTLYVDGTVQTGTFYVGLRDVGTNDDGITGQSTYCPYVNDTGLDPGFDRVDHEQVWYTQNVASCISENYSRDGDPAGQWVENLVKFNHEGTNFYEKEVITITNAYPSYAPGWLTEIACHGSIPAKISSFTLTPPIEEWPAWIELIKWIKYDDGVEVDNGSSHPLPGTTPGGNDWNIYDPGPDCYNALVAALEGQKLHECDVVGVYVELHTTQAWIEMPMNYTFDFDVAITYTQWNLVED